MVSIESTGGKELHDDALLNGDLEGSVFALGILACRNMAQLWDMIVAVAAKRQVLAAGDSACGFGNTAIDSGRHSPHSQGVGSTTRLRFSPTEANRGCRIGKPVRDAILGLVAQLGTQPTVGDAVHACGIRACLSGKPPWLANSTISRGLGPGDIVTVN